MKSEDIKKIALKNTPEVKIIEHDNFFRHDLINFLKKDNLIGIELGVAGGHYSDKMLKSGKFKKFYGVDLYEDHHDVQEYISALKLIGLEKNYVLLRMSFDEAINLFDDNFFHFIYFDGYAHTGEEGGKTFCEWYKKLKIGGLFAGDDYSENWPLVKWAVNDMVAKLGVELNITGKIVGDSVMNKYPSWFFLKENDFNLKPNKKLEEFGATIRNATRKNTPAAPQNLTIQQIENLLKQVKSRDPLLALRLKSLL